MTLTAETVQTRLAPRPVRFYPQVASTNDLALDWLRTGAPDGAVVIADEQVKGRGRLNRSWHGPAGTSLILSVILRPPPEHLAQITMLGALAITELLESLKTQAREPFTVGIKWPNDVQLNGRKVSGVLSEGAWMGDQLRGVVLGMGVNVRTDFSGTELADTAISVEPAIGARLNRLDLLAFLLARIDDDYQQLGADALFHAWKSRLNMLGQTISVKEAGVSGLAEDVEPDGALLVRDSEGTLRRVLAGDLALGSS